MEQIRVVGYEIFIDPILKGIRELIAELIARNSSVIDIGCGSGALAFHLAENNGCTVRGTDLAAEKMRRANQRKKDTNSQKVDFAKADATNLVGIASQQFDYATMSLFLQS